MTLNDCPAEESLRRYAAGTLSDEEADTIDSHLGGCTLCLGRLDNLASRPDPIVAALRCPAGPAAPDSPALVKAVDAVLAGSTQPTAPPANEVAVGTVVGGYHILECLGQGGMGRVYRARHPRLDQEVALKILRSGFDSARFIARFEAERQALALMDHPHVARVSDGGVTADGQPYIVMELVRGTALTLYCEDHGLNLRPRLELFMLVCQAVQHAHQKGMIHRDLKPSNILIAEYDGKPVPKVIDFGIAKAVAGHSAAETERGMLVGTPEYMSPEQASLSSRDMDTRSDIYALGILLYELLTGDTPLSRQRVRALSVFEVLQLIREEDSPAPSRSLTAMKAPAATTPSSPNDPATLARQVRGELDWIVLKCLQKDRDRRYATAAELAEDVRRFLHDEPVLAGPPSAAYRFRKFTRRNRAAVLTAAAILFVLVAGIAGTTFGLIRAEHRRAEAETARADEAAQRQIAEAQTKQAEQARAEEAVQRQIADAQKKKAEQAEADTLADYRASTDDAIEQLIGSKPFLGPQEKIYLEKTLKRWQAFAARQGDDERSRAIRAEGHHHVGLLWHKLGRRDEARAEYETARDLFKELALAFPADPQYQLELVRIHGNLGNLLSDLGQRDAARTEYEATRDLQQKLVAAFPAVAEFQQNLASTHNNLGVLLSDLGHRAAARAEYETARDMRKKLVAAFPAVPKYQLELAGTHINLGNLLKDLGQRDAARTEYKTACDHYKTLVAAFPAVPQYQLELARAHNNLGLLLHESGQRDAARTEYETALDQQKKLVAAFPAVPRYQQELARTHNNLGNLLASMGQPDAARTEYETALDQQKKLADAFPAVPQYRQELAGTHNGLGILLTGLREHDAARGEFETAIDLLQKLVAAFTAVAPYQQELATTHGNLGFLLDRMGRPDAARKEHETARALQQKLVVASPEVHQYQQELAHTHKRLGILLHESGQHPAARAEYEAAIDLYKKLAAAFPSQAQYQLELARLHNNLGLLLHESGQRDAARTEYETAFDLRKKLVAAFPTVPEYQVDLGGSYLNFGNLLRDGGQQADSLHWLDLAIRTLTPVYEKDRRQMTAKLFLRNSHLSRAWSYDQLMKHAEAVKDWDKAVELSSGPEQMTVRAGRAVSRLRAGETAGAVAEVVELTKTSKWAARQWYDFACVYAVASSQIADQKQAYADRSMELLHQAVKAGFKDAAHMAKNPDLDPLRKREDFQKLLAELQAGKK